MLGSTHAKNISLDANYGSGHASDWPSTVKFRLFVGNPATGGSELTSAGGYAAVTIANNSTNWPNASGGHKSNGTTVTMPTSTGAWSGQPTWWGLTDPTGNLLDVNPLSSPIVVNRSGVVVDFPVGTIVIQAR